MNTDSYHSANMNKSDYDAFVLGMITDETGLERSLRDFLIYAPVLRLESLIVM